MESMHYHSVVTTFTMPPCMQCKPIHIWFLIRATSKQPNQSNQQSSESAETEVHTPSRILHKVNNPVTKPLQHPGRIRYDKRQYLIRHIINIHLHVCMPIIGGKSTQKQDQLLALAIATRKFIQVLRQKKGDNKFLEQRIKKANNMISDVGSFCSC